MRICKGLPIVVGAFVILMLGGCYKDSRQNDSTDSLSSAAATTPPMFTLLSASKTNVNFSNTLNEGLNTNILMYEYFYNGGGVAAGDVNGDGLIDLYFTANMGSNKLYLNRGNMRFEDITQVSASGGRQGPWKTGVTFADVNGDNRLDIYVCYSGAVRDENRVNQLFINQGNNDKGIPLFAEK